MRNGAVNSSSSAIPTGKRSIAVKNRNCTNAAPVRPSTISTGRSARRMRRSDGLVTRITINRPIAVPVHRSAVRRIGSSPACRATFDTFAPSPKKAAAAMDSTVPRPLR